MVSTINGFGQDEEFKIWTSLNLKKNLKNWDFNSELELRESKFFNEMDRLSLQLEAMYDLNKTISIGSSYMIMNFHDKRYDDKQLRHRFQAIITGKADISRFTLSLREKAELTKKDDSDRIDADGDINTYRINPELLWRNRLKVEYDISGIPLAPSIALETFYFLNDPDGNSFEKLRYTLAFEYKLNKHNRFSVFGHFNNELFEDEIDSYVAGFSFTHIL